MKNWERIGVLTLIFWALGSCQEASSIANRDHVIHEISLVVLGIAQDAGFPQAGCDQKCCQEAWHDPGLRKQVSCLGLADRHRGRFWLIDATPDFPDQLRMMHAYFPDYELAGIFLTHAHIGHYTGLMHLGKEVMGAREIPVYAMPRMRQFLQENGPWNQLVDLNQIRLIPLAADSMISLSPSLHIRPIAVPHRDEFSETVGYAMEGKDKSAVFIPDIDKWEKWNRNIDSLISRHDLAFLDGTFFAAGEIPGRNMSEIPHPFISESLDRFAPLPDTVKDRLHFIHFNHTNPVLNAHSPAKLQIESAGMHIAKEGDLWSL